MFGLLGALGGGLLGLGSTFLGQRAEEKRQLSIIEEQGRQLTKQQEQEQEAYRKALRSGGSGLGTGDFRNMFGLRKFTGF